MLKDSATFLHDMLRKNKKLNYGEDERFEIIIEHVRNQMNV